MKSSKEFDNILDECLERLLGGETVEQCLQSYPEQVAELEPLLRTALTATELSTIQPGAEFKARARYQFRSALQEIGTRKGHRFFAWRTRWATAITAIVILLLVGGGTVVVAGNSMPGGALYPIKLATEQVRLTLTPSALGKAELSARLADKRVAEIIYLVEKGDSERIDLVTQRLDTHLAMIVSLAVVQSAKSGALLAPAPAAELAPPAAESAPTQPPELAPPPVPERAEEDTEDIQPQPESQDNLSLMLRYYATYHPAWLRAALDTAPESVKPALLRAISISVIGYERVLETIGQEGE